MEELFPVDMIQQLKNDNGKNAVISINLKEEYPTPPFTGRVKKALVNNILLYSKMFNGELNATREFIEINNIKAKHKPEFDLGYEIELDYLITITLQNGKYRMKYLDKSTNTSIDIQVEGFMYIGA